MVDEWIRSAANPNRKPIRHSIPVREDLEAIAERARRIDHYHIQSLIDERRVKALFHFTPIDNLKNLARYGLLSRADLLAEHIDFIPTDEHRIDGVNNASCLSLAFPNYRMFYQKRCSLTAVSSWAVLEISPSVLWEHPCLFLPRNAASLASNLRESPGYYLGAQALKRVFEESENVRRDEMGLASDFPTDPQTEVLIFGAITSDKVEAILVNDAQSLRHAGSIVMGSEFEHRLRIDRSVFAPRCDYSFWTH